MFTEDEQTEMYNNCFAHWVNCLWYAVEQENFNFLQQKSAFFWLLEKWLREGKVRFDVPHGMKDAKTGKGILMGLYIVPETGKLFEEEVECWDEEPSVIIDYLKSEWPEHATDIHDLDLNIYFYNIPAIRWVDPVTGKLHSS